MSGLQPNPGPPMHHGDVSFGCLNVHSAVHRASLVYTTIADHDLDLLMLQETWLNSDDPAATQMDIAPDGFDVLHVNRPPPPASSSSRRVRPQRAGGLAVIYRRELDVKVHRLQSSTSPTSNRARRQASSSPTCIGSRYRRRRHPSSSTSWLTSSAQQVRCRVMTSLCAATSTAPETTHSPSTRG